MSLDQSLEYYSKHYPYGIPVEFVDDDTCSFGNESAQYAFVVDYAWDQNPWENDQGEFLLSIIEKGLKQDQEAVFVTNSSSSLPQELKLAVSFGIEMPELNCNTIITNSLDDLKDDIELKKTFWNQLKSHV